MRYYYQLKNDHWNFSNWVENPVSTKILLTHMIASNMSCLTRLPSFTLRWVEILDSEKQHVFEIDFVSPISGMTKKHLDQILSSMATPTIFSSQLSSQNQSMPPHWAIIKNVA